MKKRMMFCGRSLQILSVVVIISMVFGPLVSSVKAAQMYEDAQEAAQAMEDHLALIERLENSAYPTSPMAAPAISRTGGA